jgi:spore coat polysaccharide biosynthesis protein SpsF (cytidylyltransferase family)
MIGIIIQARTGSTRLPQKMIIPFFNEMGILETILTRLKNADLNIPVVLATTTNINDDILSEIGLKQGIAVFRGSENNVLERFIKTADYHNFDKIIRICADNPFLDLEALKMQIASFNESEVDYWCYCKSDKTPTIKTHYGFWTEGVKLTALKKVTSLTNEKLFHEHVTNYIYTLSNDFNLHYENISKKIEDIENIRLTIDTMADFKLAKEIYSEILNNKILFNAEEIVHFLKEKSCYLQIMKKEISANTK